MNGGIFGIDLPKQGHIKMLIMNFLKYDTHCRVNKKIFKQNKNVKVKNV